MLSKLYMRFPFPLLQSTKYQPLTPPPPSFQTTPPNAHLVKFPRQTQELENQVSEQNRTFSIHRMPSKLIVICLVRIGPASSSGEDELKKILNRSQQQPTKLFKR